MNKIILSGNLTKDVTTRNFEKGGKCVNFSIAVNQTKDIVYFFDCKALNNIGDICEKYLHKGSKVVLSGQLNYRDWEDKNKITRRTYEINVEEITLLDSKKDE